MRKFHASLAAVSLAFPLGASADLDFGDGSDGPLSVSGVVTINTVRARVAAAATAGSSEITVSPSSGLEPGNEILILTMFDPGGDFGTYEFQHVAAAASGELVLTASLAHSYLSGGGRAHQVIRVPQFTAVSVESSATLTAPPFGGEADPTGGVLVFRATEGVTVAAGGSAEMSGRGFEGGVYSSTSFVGWQGSSPCGWGYPSYFPNLGGGGGGYPRIHDLFLYAGGGAGGGYGTAGENGRLANFFPSHGGLYGQTDLDIVALGSGGGSGGATYRHLGGTGGAGGGVILISAPVITVQGAIASDGADGASDATSEGGGGGGGSGGSIYLAGEAVTIESAGVTAVGGRGSLGSMGVENSGGDGGDGRIRIDYLTSLAGATDPPALRFQIGSVNEGTEGLIWH